jgi:hypothetical protein
VKKSENPAMFGPAFKVVRKNWIILNAGYLKELIFRRTNHSFLSAENATII